ncbi:hypothetical protein [Campylobacter gastrosuis]|uniref:Uncharacterized protein n=1 Tax=Campylobacter gastrosuis TaxID=2974576 RepID=A0ABT7HSG5_9BACT|nr:hypothetical protein [Campylobacter gastrosuis]MDL0089864.1 hypothetical protein [Campylobacter gastrosuis]
MNYEAVFFIMIENMKKMGFEGFIAWLCFIFVTWMFLMAFGIELLKALNIKKSMLDLYDSIILITLLIIWIYGIYCYGKFRIV